ncbi:5'-methylthioadenosine/adenosylhomocysteine nucleosidase [Alkalicoccus halolimnae]|uniref:adenosylhomocysteine nucleosidase n=1 Tax=Alkalicoccus halolimnae TaxID=1667239 RepID=A0A5C7EZL2_9BACI|nr:5'-methylthioadenosine/adenosylhomocysteine nucleosidase [Alkalicoccus halolimnae]TXF81577.1 5'-methylthioadenosine/adenosylhomocysteine nucleosidase [Alkalicoccus halolimnae]
MKVGIIGAMEEEIAHFTHLFTIEEKYVLAKNHYFTGNFGSCEIVLTKAGVGKVNAAAAAQKVIDYFNVDAILFTGVAGAANPDYEVGDVVISDVCQHHDIDASPLGFSKGIIPMFNGPSLFFADEKWRAIVKEAAEELEGINVFEGKIMSGEQFIADKTEVEKLRSLFGADCVEMEGAAVAQIAWMHDVPFVIIRSISDKANGEAPVSFQKWLYETAERSAAIVTSSLKKYVESAEYK